MGKNLPANARGIRDVCSIAGLGRSPGVENGNPLRYSCLENSVDSGAWKAIVYGVIELDMAEHANMRTVVSKRKRYQMCSIWVLIKSTPKYHSYNIENEL